MEQLNIQKKIVAFFGKVVGIKFLLSYEVNSVKELEQDFRNVIDEYLADYRERNLKQGYRNPTGFRQWVVHLQNYINVILETDSRDIMKHRYKEFLVCEQKEIKHYVVSIYDTK